LTERIRILGIDPGSRITGYGIVDVLRGEPVHVANGCLRLAQGEFAARLHAIFMGLSTLVADYQPDEVVIERVFMSRNADSALKLGQARGAALCATFGPERGAVPVFEYSAREIKQAVAGRGGAEKTQVQHMVRMLLGTTDPLQADAADALAAALCRAHLRRTERVLGEVGDAAVAKSGGRRRSWRGFRP
jgi:crossover junction endodeoxyribonuclease RuvC